jgi:hypothetical protein
VVGYSTSAPFVGGGAFDVFFNQGGGQFASAKTFGAGDIPTAVWIADMNGDGRADLVVRGNLIGVLFNQGSGEFGPAMWYMPGSGDRLIDIGDLNRDGKVDLLIETFHTDIDSGTNPQTYVQVLLNEGDGQRFSPLGPLTTQNAFPQLADVNGDGVDDLLLGDGSTLSIALNRGDATFSSVTQVIAAGDLNGDGFPDLAVACQSTDTLAVLLNDGTGAFAVSALYPVGSLPLDVTIADLDGDGRAEIIGADASGATVLHNEGGGTFTVLATFRAAGLAPYRVAVGDMNEDGKADIALMNSSGVLVLINSTPAFPVAAQ